jgi:hypothetical protein
MASKQLAPLNLPNFVGPPSVVPGAGFLKVYLKSGWFFKTDDKGITTDLILDRTLQGFSSPEDLRPITRFDTVKTGLEYLQKSISSLVLTGDVTGQVEYEDTGVVIRTKFTEKPGPIPVGTVFITDSFAFIGAQSFMLSEEVINILSVSVNGQVLDQSQYQVTEPRQLDILEELDVDDTIIALYNLIAFAPRITVNNVAAIDNNITLTLSDLGHGNIDNTADIDKPISNAVQKALEEIVTSTTAQSGYEHIQNTADYIWLVKHNLQKYPSIIVIGADGMEYEGQVQHIDKNNTALHFSEAIAGIASFN